MRFDPQAVGKRLIRHGLSEERSVTSKEVPNRELLRAGIPAGVQFEDRVHDIQKSLLGLSEREEVAVDEQRLSEVIWKVIQRLSSKSGEHKLPCFLNVVPLL
jgi:hypothetical protein